MEDCPTLEMDVTGSILECLSSDLVFSHETSDRESLDPPCFTETLQTDNLALHSKNISLEAQNRILSAYAKRLEAELQKLKEGTCKTEGEGVVNFSIGEFRFSAKLDKEIHFARAGSRFVSYPPRKFPTAVADLDIKTVKQENFSERVTFLGYIHSIVQVEGRNLERCRSPKGGTVTLRE
jgi:hypothetical protein